MKLETTNIIEAYVDGIKKEDAQSGNFNINNKVDNTTALGKLPQTETSIIIFVAIFVVISIGIYLYIRYKNLSKYVK